MAIVKSPEKTFGMLLVGLLSTYSCFAVEAEISAGKQAFEPAWLNLLHYKSEGGRGRYRSDVQGKFFFVAGNGHQDPEAELRADLDVLQGDSGLAYGFACTFPARTKWLTKVFGLDKSPDLLRCTDLERWRREIGAKGVTLLFASAFLGSPSSMFGHTLLRLDSDRPPLLSYAVNFAVPLSLDDKFFSPVKGLTGQYSGGFSVMPYYQKLREYQYLEKRDMWEYGLALTDSEIETLVLHIWELKDVGFPYYFLDENCGSKMLDILGVVRPSLDFSAGRKGVVIPQDVLRTVVERGALVENIHLLSPHAELISASLAESPSPNKGHASSNVEAGLGQVIRGGSHAYAGEIAIRGGYHNLLDPIEGYQTGAGVDFFTLNLRAASGIVRLESADLIGIQSMQTDSESAWSNSWRGGLSLSRYHDPHALKRDTLSLQAYYGTGYATRVRPFVLFGQLDFRLAGSFEAASLGAGPRLGFAYQDKSGYSVTGAATKLLFVDFGRSVTEIEMSAGIKLDKDYTLIGQAFRTMGETFQETRKVMIGVRRYF